MARIRTNQKRANASSMLEILSERNNEVDIIFLIRHSFKLFIYNGLQRQEMPILNGMNFKTSIPKRRQKQPCFPISKSFSGKYGQFCPIVKFPNFGNIEVNHGKR